MRALYCGILMISIAVAGGCVDDDTQSIEPFPLTDTLILTCPADTIIPINCPTHPDSIGLYPLLEGDCMAEPYISFTDSSVPGAIRRIWTAWDTCGHADTCLQSIGQGAPGPCLNDTLILTCPPDTVIPINCPADPDSIGLYPVVEGDCMAEPYVSYTDSLVPGGITRTWIASDTCGHADTCLQSIGQGAPGPCN
jgi:hypothetical protein